MTAKDVLKQLKGVWAVTSLEMDGEEVQPASLVGAAVEVAGRKFISQGMGAVYQGMLAVHPEADPAQFELVFTKGPEEGNTAYGIYSLEGDTWRICLTTRGSDRPTEFATKPGTGHALETLKRGRPVAKAVPLEIPEGAEVWKMVAASVRGQALDPRLVPTGRRVIAGSEVSVRFGQQEFTRATFRVDGSHVDYVLLVGPNKGKEQLGICAPEGSRIRICMAPVGKPRPDGFEATAENGWTSTVWEKA